jgi:hypothetical protein
VNHTVSGLAPVGGRIRCSPIRITAIKDCVNYEAPQPLALTLQIHACDEVGGACYWVTWKTGVGTVTYTCPGTFAALFRNSRLPSKIVTCGPF